jgi:hypothetical protein
MSTSKSIHAKRQSPLGGPDNPRQQQAPTPPTSPEKAPTGRLSYANSVTKNLFKSPVNPLQTVTTNTNALFRSINPGAVVFDLSHIPTTQDIIEDALLAIFEKYTPATIRGYRQIGAKGNAIEILFDPSVAAAHRKTATEQGITFKDHELKAVTTESMKTKLTFVKLRNMPLFPSEDAIVRVLTQSMATFGKIRNVSIFKKPVGHGKYHCYNGEGYVLLDTTANTDHKYTELKPFIYIPEWQTTIQAKWDNAPPSCTYCKQSGHLIRDCQIKLNSAMGIRTCYLCQQAGHTRRECPRTNGEPESFHSQTNEDPKDPKNNENQNQIQNKKQKQTHKDTENTKNKIITNQNNTVTTNITPDNANSGDNNDSHYSQESIDVESLTSSQMQELEVAQTILSQKTTMDKLKSIETSNIEEDTDDEEDGDFCPEDDSMNTETDDSQEDEDDDRISDDEVDDVEINKVINYPSLPSSYNSIHAEAQRNYMYGTRSQSSQSTQSPTKSYTHKRNNEITIPDSQASESDHDMIL